MFYDVHRLNCESDTTPNTTPEERRRRAQSEVKTASASKQSYHRSRASNANTHSKEPLKKSEPIKPRAVSISRTDSTRISMRAPKSSHVSDFDTCGLIYDMYHGISSFMINRNTFSMLLLHSGPIRKEIRIRSLAEVTRH